MTEYTGTPCPPSRAFPTTPVAFPSITGIVMLCCGTAVAEPFVTLDVRLTLSGFLALSSR